MVRKARRAFARALGRGPFRPGQIGVAVFSAAFLVAGGTALALTAPPLIQQEVAAQHAAVAPLLSSAATAEGGSGAASDADAAADAEAAGGTEGAADAAADASGSAGGGAVSFPSFEFPVIDVPTGGDAPAAGSGAVGGSGSSNGSAGGSTDGGSSGGSPAEEVPAGPSESEEQAWLAYLRQQYDALLSYQQPLAQAYASFPSLGLEPSHDVRLGCLNSTIGLRDRIDIALVGMEENRVPEDSRYYNDYLNVKRLYEDLSNAGAILVRAWFCNTQFDDPAAHKTEWMSPIAENTSGGELTYFTDYRTRYPGARP